MSYSISISPPTTSSDIKRMLRRLRSLKFPYYITASTIMSLGGLLFGLDTGLIGPITVIPSFAASLNGNSDTFSSTLHGLIVSSILIPAALSSFFAGHLSDRIGRPRSVTVGATIFGIGAGLEAASIRLAMFFVGRIITGLGEGLFLSTLTVYICEISPPRYRGTLSSTVQLLVTVGVFLGYFVAYGTVNWESSAAWRVPLALHSFVAFCVAAACCTLPQSPRWLGVKGRRWEATRIWERLGVKEAEREVVVGESVERTGSMVGVAQPVRVDGSGLDDTIRGDTKAAEAVGFFRVFRSDVRARTFLGAFLMGMQQLSGIDGVLYYAPLLFKQAGLAAAEASFLASGVSALLIFAVTIPAFLLADRWGRRTSALFGGASMAAVMFLIGSLYASGAVHGQYGATRWVVIVCIYVFALCFSISWAVGLKIYASEIQPEVTRSVATSLGQSVNWIVNFLVALTTPIFLAHSSYGVYFLFGGATLLTFGVCLIWMPETKGKSLEDINSSFESKSSSHELGSLTTRRRRGPQNVKEDNGIAQDANS